MTIFPLIQQPLYQGLFFLLLTVVLAFIGRPGTADKVWVLAGTVYLLFLLTNIIASFYAPQVLTYFFISMGISVAYLVAIGVIASMLIKALTLDGTQESAAIFLVIIMHPVGLLAAMLVKWLVR